MSDLICTCKCGHKIRVSEFAVGMQRQCGHCGVVFVIDRENTVSLGAPQRPVEEFAARSTADAKEFAGPKTCARCGKPFKGEWDRYSASAGVVCHICASLLAQQVVPGQAEKPMPLSPPPSITTGIRTEPEQPLPHTGEQTFWDRFGAFRETNTFRVGLYAAAFGVITIAVYYSFFHDFSEPPDQGHAEATSQAEKAENSKVWARLGLGLMGPPQDLTKGQHAAISVLVTALSFVLGILPTFLAILLMHLWSGGLPGSTWWAGVVHVGLMSVVATALWCIPLVGFLVALYVLAETYNFGFWDCLKLFLLRLACSYLIYPLRLLIFGAIALVFF